MKKIQILAVLFLLFLSGCAPRMAVKQGYDFSKIRRIAVLNFEGTSGGTASDLFIMELIKQGFDVIERSKIDNILKEQDMGTTGRIEADTVKKIGSILGVDAIIAGSVGQYLPAQRRTVFFPYGETVVITPGLNVAERGYDYVTYASDAEVSVSARLIDIESGSIAWASSESSTGYTTDSAFRGVIFTLTRSLKSVFPKPK